MINVEVSNTGFDERGESQWRLVWQAFRRHRLGMIGLAMLSLMILAVIAVPIIQPEPYGRVNPDSNLWTAPMGTVDPSTGHRFWLGSDKYGRDNLSLVFQAGRLSLAAAFVPALLSLVIGSIVGVVAGYYGGWIDSLLMRLADFLLALPLLPAYVLAVRIVRPLPFQPAGQAGPPEPFLVDDVSGMLLTLIVVFVLFGWMGISRLVRGMVLTMRTNSYVEAARALGASTLRIMFRHLIPNALTPLLIAGMFAIGDFIILEAIMAYFGMGFRDPIHPPVVSWGNMLAGNQDQAWYMTNLNPSEQIRGYLVLLPSTLLLITVVSINFIGDALRDVLDPRGHA